MTDASIKQLDVPCWTLTRDPEARHWLTRGAALESNEPEDVSQMPASCWVGECGGCEELMGDDDRYAQVHFDSRRELEEFARDYEWRLDGDVLRHQDCVPEPEDSR